MYFSAGRHVQVKKSHYSWKELAELNDLERSARTANNLEPKTAENLTKTVRAEIYKIFKKVVLPRTGLDA